MMKETLIIGGCFPQQLEECFYANSNGLPQIAADKLQKNILRGYYANTKTKPKMITAPFIGYFPKGYKKLFVRGCQIEDELASYSVVGFINIKGIETIIKSRKIYHRIINWCNEDIENRNIIVYSHYAAFMVAIAKAKQKISDLNVCCVITDMPELSLITPDSLLEKLKAIPRQLMFQATYKNISAVNKFVLLTEQMAEALKLKPSDYSIVECMCSIESESVSETEGVSNTNRIVFTYTGTLDKLYGISELVNAFRLTNNPSFRLQICGDGNGKQDVINACKQDSRIEYLGVVPHERAVKILEQSDILINPRNANNVFTKYSFPSKTIEYLAAGKPVIMYKLPGIPCEYDDYLIYFSGDTINDMAKDLDKIGSLDRKELKKMGNRNRKFAVTKNYIIQTGKILKLLEVECE